MKTHLFLLLLSFSVLFSCCNNQPEQKAETPVALQDKSSDFISKRYDGDLVETIYAELAEKTPELGSLEKKINLLNEKKSDSVKYFTDYDNKNQSYYQAAAAKIKLVKDSVLRAKINLMIEQSLSRYNKSIALERELLNKIEKKSIALNDMHLALKVTRSLKVIENFQRRNKPSKKPIKGIINELDSTIKLVDTLTKK